MENKYITIDGMDYLQIFACLSALKMANKGIYLAHPSAIRATASHWLTKVGVAHKPKAKWSTLQALFEATFSEVIEAVKKEREQKG